MKNDVSLNLRREVQMQLIELLAVGDSCGKIFLSSTFYVVPRKGCKRRSVA